MVGRIHANGPGIGKLRAAGCTQRQHAHPHRHHFRRLVGFAKYLHNAGASAGTSVHTRHRARNAAAIQQLQLHRHTLAFSQRALLRCTLPHNFSHQRLQLCEAGQAIRFKRKLTGVLHRRRPIRTGVRLRCSIACMQAHALQQIARQLGAIPAPQFKWQRRHLIAVSIRKANAMYTLHKIFEGVFAK